MSSPFPGYLRLLARNHGVARLWYAQVVSELGDWLNLVALFRILGEIRPGAEAPAWLLVIQMTPWVAWSPLAGIVADRFDRRRIMIAADLARAVVVLGFLLVDRPERLWLLYLLAGLQFSLAAFFEPARAALVPSLAEGEELVVANALMGVTWSLMLAVGGALGGVVAGVFSPSAAFVADSASFLASAAILFRLRGSSRDSAGRERDPGVGTAKAGFGEVVQRMKSDRRLLPVVLVKSAIAISGGGLWLLTVVYGQRLFPLGDGGSLSVGILYGVHGLGAILGAMSTAWLFRGRERAVVAAIVAALFLRTVFWAAFGAAPGLAAASLAVTAIAACGSFLWVASTTILQRIVPNNLQGRVFSIDFAGTTFFASCAAWVTGQGIDRAGISPRGASLVTAIVAGAVAAAWALSVRGWKGGTGAASQAPSR